MYELPPAIQEAIKAFAALPGVGLKSAEKMVFSLLTHPAALKKLQESLKDLENIKECPISHNFCEGTYCHLTQDPTRDHTLLCVVESPMDILTIERTKTFKGQYHVLHGLISPIEKKGPEDIRINSLLQRIQQNPHIEEVILALSGSLEGEATAFYIAEQLRSQNFSGKITRPARGMPAGGALHFLDSTTLSLALNKRESL